MPFCMITVVTWLPFLLYIADLLVSWSAACDKRGQQQQQPQSALYSFTNASNSVMSKA